MVSEQANRGWWGREGHQQYGRMDYMFKTRHQTWRNVCEQFKVLLAIVKKRQMFIMSDMGVTRPGCQCRKPKRPGVERLITMALNVCSERRGCAWKKDIFLWQIYEKRSFREIYECEENYGIYHTTTVYSFRRRLIPWRSFRASVCKGSREDHRLCP